MSTRERILTSIVGVLFATAIGYLGVKKMLLGKAEEYDSDRVRLKDELAEQQQRNKLVEGTARSIKGWTALTYDLDELSASAKIYGSLVELVERAGLSRENLSLQPVRGGSVRGAYREVGRTIHVRGKLQNVIDFLYLLRQEPHLHRLDNLSITPLPKTNEIDLQVRYITLVIDAKPAEGLQADQLPTTAPTNLDSEARKLYDPIASRDLFRPYVQRYQAPPPPPPPPPSPVRSDPSPRRSPPPPPPPPQTGRLRVVGLPDWHSRHEVLVSDSSTGQLRAYKAGDTLGGGMIAMVDYRPMPSPINPKILSPSRVILRVGPDFWAVELGQNITDKRRLKEDQLPEKLRSLPETAPGNMVKENGPAER